ncbi:adenylate kinase [candidate division NPL-UPA2 bacterium Unc8]|uniref:Adenylate kinase n=1 Tax=candidate division NPL-UPA2 bacterium Unc8 TaxID=1980939 RepID=A0A399FXU9_UNCN2|nr:adenylate kinase [Bacillota bacterium]MBT9138171.1 adenylate kinase [Bacillota bacterium]MBT9146844.1 adenylate kinase [Bacillota bacterium]RII00286.1 MAG: adenylate kinase [candidate division NPL-UPA2 bacterium Unc8]
MRLILLGPPGAGKGVIAKLLSEKLSLPHISTGDILRRAINEETPLGRDAKACVESGGLLSNEIMISLIKERLSATDCERGFILDGFPRTLNQAKALSNMEAASGVAPGIAINLDAPREVLISRLSGRRVCPSCQALYHVENMPPRKEGICDGCGSQIVIREDDQESVVKERLLRYEEEVKSLFEFYKERNLLKEVNSNMEPEKVLKNILKVIDDSYQVQTGDRLNQSGKLYCC